MRVLAIDIGGTKVATALVDGPRVVDRAWSRTDLSDGAEGLLARVAESARRWDGDFDAVGAAVTGLVRDGWWRALNPATLALPEPFALAQALTARFRLPAFAANDAQAAAWGEWLHGAGLRRDMVFLTISTGIGGGIVAGGRLLGGLAGHFGQFVTEEGGKLEDGVAGRWIARAAADAGHAVDAAGVFAAADDALWANDILERSAAHVARLCRNVQLALDPVRIVIGGGVGLAPGFVARVEAALAAVEPALRPRLAPAGLGADAGLIGVAALAAAECRSDINRETAK